MGVIGLSSQGLQIFYPINGELLIYLYDPKCYKTPSNTGSKILRSKDVVQINIAQYMWSGDVVYLSRTNQERFITELSDICHEYLPFERTINRESERVEMDGDETRSLLHSYRAHIPFEADFSFSKERSDFIETGNLIRGQFTDPPEDKDTISYKFPYSGQDRKILSGIPRTRALNSFVELT